MEWNSLPHSSRVPAWSTDGSVQIGSENSFLRRKWTISALDALRDALYESLLLLLHTVQNLVKPDTMLPTFPTLIPVTHVALLIELFPPTTFQDAARRQSLPQRRPPL